MSHHKTLAALVVVGILLIGAAGPVSAHSWQTTVTQGPMELGISSSPAKPVAGMQTEFSARIADSEVSEGDADRLSWGGVTNKTVEVHIHGPDGLHDHITAEIPEDDAHFHFSYLFPTDGNYSITVVAELEGEEYAFEFTRQVMLMPVDAQGEQMKHLSEDLHSVNENIESTNEKVDSLQTQVEELQSQVNELQSEIESQSASHEEETETAQAEMPGFTITAALMALAAAVAFAVGRRRS